MPAQWRVLKFGGTSLDGAGQWQTIAELVAAHRDNGDRVLLVCSALAGVTNALQAMSVADNAGEHLLDKLLQEHAELAAALKVDAGNLLAEARSRMQQAVAAHARAPGPERLAALLATGEWLSSRLGQLILSRRLEVDWVDATGALQVLPEEQPDAFRAWLSARCAAGAAPDLTERWAALAPVLITQGFVADKGDGRVALLGRGGSDTSAALLAGRLSAPSVEIWTDVPGLFSADPMQEPGARLLKELDYGEALEMAASGARVVHPRCIRAASECGLPILIRDIRRPGLDGTRIAADRGALRDSADMQGAKAVTRQDGMLVMLLENLDTRRHVGFLAWVFGVISELGISIDLVATSETTTTLAINGVDNHLDRRLIELMSGQLSERCKLRLFPDCCCVNLVGRGVRTVLARLGTSADTFREWPLLMLSLSANDMCLSFLVHPGHAAGLLHDLHQQLVLDGANGTHPVFGPAWNELDQI